MIGKLRIISKLKKSFFRLFIASIVVCISVFTLINTLDSQRDMAKVHAQSSGCSKTLNPGDKIQEAIDAVRDHSAQYTLCLNPGFYRSGWNGQVLNETNHDFGDTVDPADLNKNDDGPYYGNIVIKNRKNFTLRGLSNSQGQRATVVANQNNQDYTSISDDLTDPKAHAGNDKAIVIKVVNGDNITLENLVVDGFYYPDTNNLNQKESVLNRLVWFQNTKNSKITNNIIKNAGGECVRIKTNSQNNEISYNTIKGCGYYQFKIQPLERLYKNGETIYVGTDPYQIRVNQIYRQEYWGLDRNLFTDRSSNNKIHHNQLDPGSRDDLATPPTNANQMRAGVKHEDNYGNECVDLKEDFESEADFETTIRAANAKEAAADKLTEAQIQDAIARNKLRGAPGGNIVTDNVCKSETDEESGGYNSRGPNNTYEYNTVTGVIRGPALRFGGGLPKAIVASPKRSDPEKEATGTVVFSKKWQATGNKIRKNRLEAYFNDTTFDYEKGDCDSVTHVCSRLNTKYVVKTFAEPNQPPEPQATGDGVCGNVNKNGVQPPDSNWSTNYLGQTQTFSRISNLAVNSVCTAADKNTPAGPRQGNPPPTGTAGPTSTSNPSGTPAPTCATKSHGDANCDGSIDLLDFEVFRSEFISFRQGQLDINQAQADFNSDKTIDLLDFEIFRQGFIAQRQGTPTPSSSPTTSPTVRVTASPTSSVTPTQQPSTKTYPAQVLNLANWKVQLPILTASSIDIFQPELATYKIDPWFIVSPGGNSVRFRAPVNGKTTPNSSYPRSELREMTTNGTVNAAWSSTSGTHTMFVDQAITAVPTTKKEVVAGQVHDANDDVIVIRLEYPKLLIDVGGSSAYTLDSNYTLGKRFTVKFVVNGGKTQVFYNGSTSPVYTLSKSYSGAYFKAGAYTQSNCSTEGSSSLCNDNNFGEVVIYDVSVTHQ